MSNLCANCPNTVNCVDCAVFADDTGSSVGSYERHCNDYAAYGDAERDHYDYEAGAAYDRYDGLRSDCSEDATWEARYDDEPCPDCGWRADCAACVAAKSDYDACVAETAYNGCADDDDVPF